MVSSLAEGSNCSKMSTAIENIFGVESGGEAGRGGGTILSASSPDGEIFLPVRTRRRNWKGKKKIRKSAESARRRAAPQCIDLFSVGSWRIAVHHILRAHISVAVRQSAQAGRRGAKNQCVHEIGVVSPPPQECIAHGDAEDQRRVLTPNPFSTSSSGG